MGKERSGRGREGSAEGREKPWHRAYLLRGKKRKPDEDCCVDSRALKTNLRNLMKQQICSKRFVTVARTFFG